MSYLDFVVIAVVAYNGWIGFRKGLIRVVLDLIAMVVGLSIAITSYPQLALPIQLTTRLPVAISNGVAFGVLWGAIFFGISSLGKLLGKVSRFSPLGPLDSLGGVAIGGIKGLLIVLPVLMPLIFFRAPIIEKSPVITPFLPVVKYIMTHWTPSSLPVLESK